MWSRVARRPGVLVFVRVGVFAVAGMAPSSVGGVATAATAALGCCFFFFFEASALFFVLGVFVEEVACGYEFEAAEDDHVDKGASIVY